MTPTEKEIYEMHMFDLGDEVEIASSGVVGEITGLRITEGSEDRYRVLYVDRGGVPREKWWRSSLLEIVEPDDTNSNVVCFDCAKAALAESRNATKH